MNVRIEIRCGDLLTLPTGVTVGDEFRIAGRVRVVAISQDEVEVTGFGDPDLQFLPGETTVELRLLGPEVPA